MRVIDGLHRLRAASRLGRDEVSTLYFDGTEDEAFALSVHLNVHHGLPLSLDDRKSAARRILVDFPGWSDRLISRLAGISHTVVASERIRSTGESSQLNGRMGQDGKVRPLDAAAGRLRAADVLGHTPGASLREIARAAGISVSTARDVRLRVQQGLDPVPDGIRGRRTDELPPEDADLEAYVPANSLQPRTPSIGPPASRKKDGPPSRRPPLASSRVGLDQLAKDPAIRFSERGRSLVRHLNGVQSALEQCHALLDAVPSHCAAIFVEIARNHAEAWRNLAHDVDELVDADSPRRRSV